MRFGYLALCAMLAVASIGCKKKTPGPGGGTPTPSPGPSATATPPPASRPDLNAVCNSIGDGPGGGTCSPQGKYKNMPQVIAAIYQVPDSYFHNNGNPRDPKAFIDEVYRRLNGFGLCGAFDGQKLLVRDREGNAEYYTLYHEAVTMGRFVQAHSQCSKAPKFPTWDQTSFNPIPPACSLPPSVFTEGAPGHHCEDESTGEVAKYKSDVFKALDEVIAEERASSQGVFDFTQELYGSPKINGSGWESEYLERIAGKLRSWGYCALRSFGTQDGVEVKKTNNTSSEYYDLVIDNGQLWVRRKYIGTCYPATF